MAISSKLSPLTMSISSKLTMAISSKLMITKPDDGDLLQAVAPHSGSDFGRAVTKQLVTTTAAAVVWGFGPNNLSQSRFNNFSQSHHEILMLIVKRYGDENPEETKEQEEEAPVVENGAGPEYAALAAPTTEWADSNWDMGAAAPPASGEPAEREGKWQLMRLLHQEDFVSLVVLYLEAFRVSYLHEHKEARGRNRES